MAEEATEDPGCTADATAEEEDTVSGSTATEAMGAANTAAETKITPEPERTAQIIETQEAGGTPGEGTTAAMAGAPITAIRTSEEAEIAVWSPGGGRMNGALDHEGRPHLRYNSQGSTPQRRDSSAARVTCWHCGQRWHYSAECWNPPTDRKDEPSAGPSTTMGPKLPTAQPTATHTKAGAAGH